MSFMSRRILTGSVALITAAMLTASAAQAQSQMVDKVITVTGEAVASVVPDIAMSRGGVTTQGKTAKEASDSNAKEMTAVIEALKAAGIAERDIQTTRLSIYPQQDPNKAGKARIIGFQASNQVNVRLRDINKIADALDRMINAGANEISGVSFSVSDPSKALDAARKDAVADAKRKADIYAQAAGVGLGRAVAIQEEGTPPLFQPRPMALRAAAAPPVQPGEETLRISVTIAYELMH
ncbi:MAG: SIMPL domain-containing protein [Pseudolabrys sp.]